MSFGLARPFGIFDISCGCTPCSGRSCRDVWFSRAGERSRPRVTARSMWLMVRVEITHLLFPSNRHDGSRPSGRRNTRGTQDRRGRRRTSASSFSSSMDRSANRSSSSSTPWCERRVTACDRSGPWTALPMPASDQKRRIETVSNASVSRPTATGIGITAFLRPGHKVHHSNA